MFLQEVCQAFHQAKIPYAIVGGYAVALHGAVRGTVDVDVAIRWSLKNLQNVEKILLQMGLVSRLPIHAKDVYQYRDEYIQNRNLIAWNFYDPLNPANQLDLIITYDLKGARVNMMHTGLGDVRVLSKRDLIEMKKASGRRQDLEDIRALENC